MPADDPNLRAWGELFAQLAPLIVGLGVLGVVIIVGLVIAWRRYQRRQAQLEEAHQQRARAEPIEDLWALSAARGQDRADAPPGHPDAPPPYTRPPEDKMPEHPDDDDEDDPDAHAPWRDSLPDLPAFSDDDDDDFDEDEEDDDDFTPPDDVSPSGGDWPRPPRKP